MKYSGIVFLVLAAHLMGCEKNERGPGQSMSVASSLPSDLRPLQGEWMADDGEGRLSIEGRMVRLLFTHSETGQLYRRNVFIEKVDGIAHKLEMRGERVPWHYGIQQDGLKDSITIRFYDSDNHTWVGSAMSRTVERLARF